MSGEPLFAGAIYGVRTWVIRDHLTLSGLGTGSTRPWVPNGHGTDAICLSYPHAAPQPDCECGLYAIHPFAFAPDWIFHMGEAAVIGLVEAWGRIELHPIGFRAERARPKVLFAPAPHLVSTGHLEKLRRVAARYRVPLVELPLPEHAPEWCRSRGLGLSESAVEDTMGPARANVPSRRGSRSIGRAGRSFALRPFGRARAGGGLAPDA